VQRSLKQPCQPQKKDMKNINTFSARMLLFALALGSLSSCMKDRVKGSYSFKLYTPVYQTLQQARQSMKNSPATNLQHVGKIYARGKYIFLNELERGIHVIDNSNPASPVNVAFVNIPGNEDMAIKGNTMYADSYGDLIVLDVTNPLQIAPVNVIPNAFPGRSVYSYTPGINPDSVSIVTGWTVKDTTVTDEPNSTLIYFPSCLNCGIAMNLASPALSAYSSSANSSTGNGTAGSLARFAVINDYLYTVDFWLLSAFNVSNSTDPVLNSNIAVDSHIETIYPFNGTLFIGSNIGMYMYDVQSSPGNPKYLGEAKHVRACDPVIADGNFAYVTLSDGTPCLGLQDQMDLVDYSNIYNPILVKTYPMTHPLGLAKDGPTLLICDDTQGLKVYDASDPLNMTLTRQLKDAQTIDIIAQGGVAVVVAKEGLFMYDYSIPESTKLIGKLLITN